LTYISKNQGEKMRILVVGQFGGIGGAERSLIPLAKELDNNGHELTLLLMKTPENNLIFNQFPGKVFIPNSSSGMDKLKIWMNLNKLVATTDLIIATSELTPTYITWLLSLWYRKPLIADVQVYLSRWIKDSNKPIHNHLCRFIYPRISYIRCVAEGVAEDLLSNYNVPDKNLSTIYVPFELEEIQQVAELPIPTSHSQIFSKPTIVTVGRFTSQKRFDVAIEAFNYFYKQYSIDANFLILGDGELRPQLEKQVKNLGLTDRIFMPGFVENPHAYVKSSQVFLLSSDYEGLPRVLIEALAVGCPVVATNCPSGPDEILKGGECGGLLTPMGEPEKIGQAIAQVLTNPELSQKLHKSGLQRAKDFSTQTVVQQYQNLINQALSTT
jgi:glycosyltransferase involved in cell wall biosynthesis